MPNFIWGLRWIQSIDIYLFYRGGYTHVTMLRKKDIIFYGAGFGGGFPYLWFRELPFLPVPFLLVPFLRAPWPLRLP